MSVNLDEVNSIYRFFDDQDHNIKGLDESYLWFSEISSFNDPFETAILREDIDVGLLDDNELAKFCQINQGLEFGEPDSDFSVRPADEPFEHVKNFIKNKRSEVLLGINEYIYKTIRTMQLNKFHCLSHDAGNDPIQNRLMWSHYSNGMKGFVIDFDMKLLLNSQRHKNKSFQGFTEINYMNLDYNNYIREITNNNEPIDQRYLVFTKHNDWDYENEIRLIGGESKMYYHDFCIKRIIIGSRMDQESLQKLLAVIERKGLTDKVYMSSIVRKKFSVEIEKIYKN